MTNLPDDPFGAALAGQVQPAHELDEEGVDPDGCDSHGDILAEIAEIEGEVLRDAIAIPDKVVEPRALGYSVNDMNQTYSLVLMGSKSVIFVDQPSAPIEDRRRVLTLDAFKVWFLPKKTEVWGDNDKIKVISWATRWLSDRNRRQYEGVEFHPNPDGAPSTPGYLNLWSGYSVEPRAKKNGWSILRDHMLNNICYGDEAIFRWLFGFFAHMMQRPRERIGVALVLRGKMGSGKSKLGEVFGSLIEQHYFLVDDPRYVTGQFNAHMATCLLLQAEEAVWAGDKAAEGRLKGLITSPMQQIEAKGVDPIRLKNYVRIMMTSNEDWVVPAGKDERRFAVLDVHPRVAQNHDYFREMDEELDAGGREALLADLLAFDLNSVNLRQIPRTEALLEQKIRSLNPVETWWFARLEQGAVTRGAQEWHQEVSKTAVFDDYINASEKIGVRRKSAETEFAMALRKLVPGLDGDKKKSIEVHPGQFERMRVWIFPPLVACREAMSAIMQQDIAWPGDDPRERPDLEG